MCDMQCVDACFHGCLKYGATTILTNQSYQSASAILCELYSVRSTGELTQLVWTSLLTSLTPGNDWVPFHGFYGFHAFLRGGCESTTQFSKSLVASQQMVSRKVYPPVSCPSRVSCSMPPQTTYLPYRTDRILPVKSQIAKSQPRLVN